MSNTKTILFNVDEDAWKIAVKMFNRSTESALEDVITVKEWIKTQPHLPEVMEDVKIRNFLLLNKHSVEKTKQKIDMYYTIRSLISDMFENSNPNSESMKEFMNNSYCCVHPDPVDALYRVYFIKPTKPNTFSPHQVGMQCTNISEVRLYEDLMVGEVIVFDMDTISMADITKISPTVMLKLVAVYEKVFSQRLKAAYVVNSPPFVVKLMAILRAVLKPKLFDRIKVCEDTQILKEVFTDQKLPKDYGGQGPSLQELNELMMSKFHEYQKRFDLLDTMRVDEKLRPQQLSNDEVLGFHGNFKKLSVD